MVILAQQDVARDPPFPGSTWSGLPQPPHLPRARAAATAASRSSTTASGPAASSSSAARRPSGTTTALRAVDAKLTTLPAQGVGDAARLGRRLLRSSPPDAEGAPRGRPDQAGREPPGAGGRAGPAAARPCGGARQREGGHPLRQRAHREVPGAGRGQGQLERLRDGDATGCATRSCSAASRRRRGSRPVTGPRPAAGAERRIAARRRHRQAAAGAGGAARDLPPRVPRRGVARGRAGRRSGRRRSTGDAPPGSPSCERELRSVCTTSCRGTREDMQTSQEELRSANEELQSTNEELQSTNEELTTSKEEMQSMNEELQTVNAELQAKVDELSRASNDMKNLLEQHGDRHHLPRRRPARPPLHRAGDPPHEAHPGRRRPAHHRPRLRPARPGARPRRWRRCSARWCRSEKEVATADGRWFTMRVMPYRTLDDVIDGVVITFMDISAVEAARGASSGAAASASARCSRTSPRASR